MQTNRQCVIACVVSAVFSLVLGILVGYFSKTSDSETATTSAIQTHTTDVEQSTRKLLLDSILPENMKENLRYLTRKAHQAGTPGNLETAQYVRSKWIQQGIEAEIVPYDVLLSYPEDNHNNTVSIVEADGSVSFTTSLGDIGVKLAADQADGVQPYNGFSPSGSPQGQLVYANYGRDIDYDILKAKGINCSGKIVIARYGKIFRGNKASLAQAAGAVGLILYSDPADHLPSANYTKVFPESWWLPGSGVQRGGLAPHKGDQLTPGYPSTWYVYRLSDADVQKRLPQIPVHPIGYDDALPLLSSMLGPESPEDFKGGLSIPYRLGPGMRQNRTIKMDVRNYNTMRTIHNVIGKIKGSVETDRYVLIGNHRDAWVQGAIDPSSGTAALLEISRAFGVLVSKGWRPRRTLLFCSWDGEEQGMVGSVEWVEEHLRVLEKRAVAYLNVDVAVKGNVSFGGKAVPLLNSLMLEATKHVPDPYRPEKTVYESWMENFPDQSSNRPMIKTPGSGSDYHAFILVAGIPVTSSRYMWSSEIKISNNPLYHTAYDLFSEMMLIDPTFVCHQAVARVNAVMMLELADSVILPLDVVEYATSLVKFVRQLQETYESQAGFRNRNISFASMTSAVQNFSLSATQFHQRLQQIDKLNPIQVRMVNDQLMAVERIFIDPSGLPGRKDIKHVVFAPALTNSYGGAKFSGIADLAYKIDPNNEQQWEEIKKHVSVLTYAIQSAANLLKS